MKTMSKRRVCTYGGNWRIDAILAIFCIAIALVKSGVISKPIVWLVLGLYFGLCAVMEWISQLQP